MLMCQTETESRHSQSDECSKSQRKGGVRECEWVGEAVERVYGDGLGCAGPGGEMGSTFGLWAVGLGHGMGWDGMGCGIGFGRCVREKGQGG